MKNAISWFEIPVTNYERAKSFYTTILGNNITDSHMADFKYGVFAYDKDNNGVGGGIVETKSYIASTEGVVLYLNGGDNLSEPLSRVVSAGGSIVIPKTDIGKNGYMAHILDTEGNKIALQSWA